MATCSLSVHSVTFVARGELCGFSNSSSCLFVWGLDDGYSMRGREGRDWGRETEMTDRLGDGEPVS